MEPLASHGVRHDANHVGFDQRTGIPAAFRRVDVGGSAHLPAVREERDVGDVAAALARQDAGFERQAIADVFAFRRRHDLQLQLRLGGPGHTRRKRQQRDRQDRSHGRTGTGRRKPIAATAPT
jgi:hypothetical protein